jgi:hypothetical protein
MTVGTSLLAIVVASGLEEFPSDVPWGFVLGSTLISIMFNFLVNYGVSVTLPILISIGSLVATALNVVVALVRNSDLPDATQAVGMCSLCLSLGALIVLVHRR